VSLCQGQEQPREVYHDWAASFIETSSCLGHMAHSLRSSGSRHLLGSTTYLRRSQSSCLWCPLCWQSGTSLSLDYRVHVTFFERLQVTFDYRRHLFFDDRQPLTIHPHTYRLLQQHSIPDYLPASPWTNLQTSWHPPIGQNVPHYHPPYLRLLLFRTNYHPTSKAMLPSPTTALELSHLTTPSTPRQAVKKDSAKL
jgi:hypothetical protein